MAGYLLTWAIRDRHDNTNFHSEVIGKYEDLESHIAETMRRQNVESDGPYMSKWHLVMALPIQDYFAMQRAIEPSDG